MRCTVCCRPMTPLFTSCVCDWCDGLKKPAIAERAWVLWDFTSATRSGTARELYVFPSRAMAEYYRSQTNSSGTPAEVLSEHPISWFDAKGTLANLRLARKRYSVYPDFKFEPKPDTAFLASDD